MLCRLPPKCFVTWPGYDLIPSDYQNSHITVSPGNERICAPQKSTDTMKHLLPMFLFFSYSTSTLAEPACDALIGMWSSERYDSTLSSDRKTIKAINADGSYWIKFIHDNGGEITTQEETGTWSCSGDVLGIEIVTIDQKQVSLFSEYRLVSGNSSAHTIKPIDPNCSRVIGDCSSDLLLEYYRVLN